MQPQLQAPDDVAGQARTVQDKQRIPWQSLPQLRRLRPASALLKRFMRNFCSSACSGQAAHQWQALNHVQVQLESANVSVCAHQQLYEGQAESTVWQSGRGQGSQHSSTLQNSGKETAYKASTACCKHSQLQLLIEET